MATVELYTKFTCPYSIRALRLLDEKGVSYTNHDITGEAELRATMIDRANGRTTVPQIFINGQHIGGCDDMVALDRAGKLDPLLAAD